MGYIARQMRAMAIVAARSGVDPDDAAAVDAWYDSVLETYSPNQAAAVLDAIADVTDSLSDDDVEFTSPEKPSGKPIPGSRAG